MKICRAYRCFEYAEQDGYCLRHAEERESVRRKIAAVRRFRSNKGNPA